MVNLDDLIRVSRDNHYKLLTLVGDNPAKVDEITAYLEDKDWEVYDVEENVLDLIEDIPEGKIYLRIGDKIKKWVNTLGDRIVLTNTSILCSPELDKITPLGAFKYLMRGSREAVLFLDARIRDNKAIYSRPGRDDYCEMDLSEVISEQIDNVIIGGDD
ncbi:BREX-3 system P-loop-containing protein BrxF [Acetohalobium arabaticum]|uniref:BREX-3 system P-loop-containing protein BrxF n=1 Tax=Acetohalobium arabaticum (strain ATCC 49924 / DSM 5501 / Z-7288) TaxID=574087 RepID=D9QQV9_ACEAZ|nr:BREX-3 system P-loop-containing protein BrxF [Acetohalobium arabaticum]ADL12900.1 conserved hypothetical protein [Acetohalobium arabaticum DSM 5501]